MITRMQCLLICAALVQPSQANWDHSRVREAIQSMKEILGGPSLVETSEVEHESSVGEAMQNMRELLQSPAGLQSLFAMADKQLADMSTDFHRKCTKETCDEIAKLLEEITRIKDEYLKMKAEYEKNWAAFFEATGEFTNILTESKAAQKEKWDAMKAALTQLSGAYEGGGGGDDLPPAPPPPVPIPEGEEEEPTTPAEPAPAASDLDDNSGGAEATAGQYPPDNGSGLQDPESQENAESIAAQNEAMKQREGGLEG